MNQAEYSPTILTLNDFLSTMGFYAEEEDGKYIVYDQEDGEYEEECTTIKDALWTPGGHIDGYCQSMIETICDVVDCENPDFKEDEYDKLYDWIISNYENFKEVYGLSGWLDFLYTLLHDDEVKFY